MKPSKNAIAKAKLGREKKKSPLANAISQLHLQRSIINKNLKSSIQQINNSGINSKKMVNSLSIASNNISPLSRQAIDVKVTILKTISYKQLPDTYLSGLKDVKARQEALQDGLNGSAKFKIIPVQLEKPLKSLHQTTGAIQLATLSKPEELRQGETAIEVETEMLEVPKPPVTARKKVEADLPVLPVIPMAPSSVNGTAKGEVPKAGDVLEKPKAKPFRIKDLGFTQLTSAPKSILDDTGDSEEIEQLEKKIEEEYEADIEEPTELEKSRVSEESIGTESLKEKPPTPVPSAGLPMLEMPLKAPELSPGPEARVTDYAPKEIRSGTTKSVTPIVAALGLLSGSIGSAALKVPLSRPIVDKATPKVTAAKATTPPHEIKVETLEKSIESDQKEISLLKTGEGEAKESIEPPTQEPITIPEIDEKDTSQSILPPITPPKPKPISDIESPTFSRIKPTKPTNWVPIAAAIGLVGGLASLATATNLQMKKGRLIPRPAAKPVKGKSIKMEDSVSKKTVKEPFSKKSVIVERKVELPKPMIRGEVPSSEIVPIKPMPAMIGSVGAIGLLSLAAGKTTTGKEIIAKPPKPYRAGVDAGFEIEPMIIKKQLTSMDANIPSATGTAIGRLTTAAGRTKSSFYIDSISKPSKVIKEPELPIRPIYKPGKILKKSVELDRRTAKAPQISKPTYEIIGMPEKSKIERSLLIDGGSVDALGLLTTAAVTSAITKTDIYSKSLPELARTKDTDKIPSKLPVTAPVAVQPYSPKIILEYSPIGPRGIRIDRRGLILKAGVKVPDVDLLTKPYSYPKAGATRIGDRGIGQIIPSRSVDAIGILGVVASSVTQPRSQVPPTKQTIAEIPERLTTTTIERPARIPVSPGKEVRRHKEAIQYARPKGVIHRLPSLAEAFGLIRRHERRLARVRLGAGISTIAARPSIGAGEGVTAQPGAQPIGIARPTATVSPLQRAIGIRRALATGVPRKEDARKQYQAGPPRSADFDRIPPGAPVKRDPNKEQLLSLEEQVRILREQLKTDIKEGQPPARKLQEFVHDPNLQTQLKKLFYESWLENMDKELKRYGE